MINSSQQCEFLTNLDQSLVFSSLQQCDFKLGEIFFGHQSALFEDLLQCYCLGILLNNSQSLKYFLEMKYYVVPKRALPFREENKLQTLDLSSKTNFHCTIFLNLKALCALQQSEVGLARGPWAYKKLTQEVLIERTQRLP